MTEAFSDLVDLPAINDPPSNSWDRLEDDLQHLTQSLENGSKVLKLAKQYINLRVHQQPPKVEPIEPKNDAQLQVLQQTNFQLEKQLQESEAKCTLLEIKLEKLQSDGKKLRNAQTTPERQENEMRALQQKITTMESQLRESQAKCTLLEIRLENSQSDEKRLRNAQTESQDNEMRALQQKITTMESVNQNYRDDLSAAIKKIERLQQENNDLQDEIQQKQSVKNSRSGHGDDSQEIKQLKKEITDLKGGMARIKQENNDLKYDKRCLFEEKAQLDLNLLSAKQELDQMGEYSKVKDELAQLQDLATQHTEKEIMWNKTLTDFGKELRKRKPDGINSFEQWRIWLLSEIKEVVSDRADKANKLQNAEGEQRRLLSKLNEVTTTKDSTIRELNMRLEAEKNKQNAMQQELTQLQERLENQDANLAAATIAVNSDLDATKLKEEKRKLEAIKKNLEERLKKIKSERDEWQDSCEEQGGKLEEYRISLEKAHEELRQLKGVGSGPIASVDSIVLPTVSTNEPTSEAHKWVCPLCQDVFADNDQLNTHLDSCLN